MRTRAHKTSSWCTKNFMSACQIELSARRQVKRTQGCSTPVQSFVESVAIASRSTQFSLSQLRHQASDADQP